MRPHLSLFCNWVNRLNEGVVEALIHKVKPGSNKRLVENELKAIKSIVLSKSPNEYGFNSAAWTGPLLIELIHGPYSNK